MTRLRRLLALLRQRATEPGGGFAMAVLPTAGLLLTIASYLLVCTVLFATLWLVAIVPATLTNATPVELVAMGLGQNPVWVLDFAFTFPMTVLGALWLRKRRPWGFVLGGTMTIFLTLETAGIAVDQAFGHLHDPSASLDAIGPMIVFTVLGLVFSGLFLRGVREPTAPGEP